MIRSFEVHSKTPYEGLKVITDAVYGGQRTEWARDVLDILVRNGIRPRQDDGTLHALTFSVAKSKEETLVVGLRYRKRDGTLTEDTFLFHQGSNEITRCYGKKLEKLLPEYRGTHKAQPIGPDPIAGDPTPG